jgi:phytol kinase
LAPATLFLGYTRLVPAAQREADGGEVREHDMHAVAGVVMPALAWLFASRALGRPELLAPYTASFVAQLAMIGVVCASAHAPGGRWVRLLGIVVKGALLVLPAMALHRPWTQAVMAATLALAGAVVAGVAINRGINGVTAGLDEEQQWLRQARWAAAASLVTALALLV